MSDTISIKATPVARTRTITIVGTGIGYTLRVAANGSTTVYTPFIDPETEDYKCLGTFHNVASAKAAVNTYDRSDECARLWEAASEAALA